MVGFKCENNSIITSFIKVFKYFAANVAFNGEKSTQKANKEIQSYFFWTHMINIVKDD